MYRQLQEDNRQYIFHKEPMEAQLQHLLLVGSRVTLQLVDINHLEVARHFLLAIGLNLEVVLLEPLAIMLHHKVAQLVTICKLLVVVHQDIKLASKVAEALPIGLQLWDNLPVILPEIQHIVQLRTISVSLILLTRQVVHLDKEDKMINEMEFHEQPRID